MLERFSDLINIYDYIKDFKENQVEYFKQYLQFEEEKLLSEKKKAEEYENKRQLLIGKFKTETERVIFNNCIFNNDDLEKLLSVR